MKENSHISQWFNEARLGNKQCFNNLLTFYYPQTYAYALKICKYNNIAEDALQEAFINSYTHFNEVKLEEKFSSWLNTIVRRSCWKHMNSSKNLIPLSAKLIDSKIVDDTLEYNLEQNNLSEFIHERINNLSDSLQLVVILRFFTEFDDYESISRILDIPIGTVRSRLNEAKKQLKKNWNANLNDLPENLQSESAYWNEFYTESFNNAYKTVGARNKIIEHLLPEVKIHFTSGKINIGRDILKNEIEEDVKFGTRYNITTAFNLKDIGVLQGQNLNSPEYPDRCPYTTTLIFKRLKDKAYFVQMHNQQR